jgi:pantoate kinase
VPAEASAFCPGHITAFFEIVEDRDPMRKGSRGVGLCTTLGVKTKVKARQHSRQEIRVFVNRELVRDSTTERAIRILIGGAAYQVFVQADAQLPVSQGFGMSGAGALSAALAVNEALDLGFSRDRCVVAAHRADVEAGTGLGDVLPQSLGGMDIRTEPGAPPHGQVRRITAEMELLLVTAGLPIQKKAVLGNPDMAAKITAVGHRCVQEFASNPTKENLFRLGAEFSVETGLASPRTVDAIKACSMYGMASMAMLGNAVFATGQMENLVTVLTPFGPRYRCKVENQGARVFGG